MKNIDVIMKKLQQGIDDMYNSDKYKQYLTTISRFHHYSINNCLLIHLQRPDATFIAGYNMWRDTFHRNVIKGEKGITIIAPSPFKVQRKVEIRDDDGHIIVDSNGTPITEQREYIKQGFKTTTVFDISQTEGEPLPTITSLLVNPVAGFDDYLRIIKELSPVPVHFENIKSGANGYYSPSKKEIVIQRGMSEEQTLKTLLHECAHARLGHGGDNDHFDNNTREVQAESISYCCCQSIGIDASDYSFGYIAGWSSEHNQKELKENLHIIREHANQMISEIEQKMQQIMEIRQEHNLQTSPNLAPYKMSF